MAVMQSKTFLYLYQVANQNEGRVIPQVKASKLQSIPFPAWEVDNPVWNEIGRLGRQMMKLNEQLATVRTGYERTALQRQIASTDRQIELLVQDLYELTQDEAAVVQSAPLRALGAIGAWADLNWSETAEALEQIRHESEQLTAKA
jgi:hypothetical protein